MGRDMRLNAQIDPWWQHVVLTSRQVRMDTLRVIAELHAKNPDQLQEFLDDLAAGLDRPAEGWDESVADFEANTGMDEAAVEVSEQDALRLADELMTAAALTSTARRRSAEPINFPQQQDRRPAA